MFASLRKKKSPTRSLKSFSSTTFQRPQSTAGRLAHELLLAILTHVPRLTECESEHDLISLLSFPLVCRAWRGPGQTALYEAIELVTSESSKLLLRSLRENPLLCCLIRKIAIDPGLKYGDAELKVWNKVLGQVPELRALSMPTRKSPGEGMTVIADPVANLGIRLFEDRLTHLRRVSLSAQSRPWIVLSILMPSIEDLTLNGYRLGQPMEIDSAPIPRLKKLRLEWCITRPTQLEAYLSQLRPTLTHLSVADLDCQFLLPEPIPLEDAFIPIASHLTSFAYEIGDEELLAPDSQLLPSFTKLDFLRLDIVTFRDALSAGRVLNAETVCISVTGRQISLESAHLSEILTSFGESAWVLPATKVFKVVCRQLQDHRLDEKKFTDFCWGSLREKARRDNFKIKVEFEWERPAIKRMPKLQQKGSAKPMRIFG